MLGILLLLLKIIGVILLIILFLIALVLFVPVRYRAEGSYYDVLKGKAKVSWLLSIFAVHVTYEKEVDMAIRIFGIRINRKDTAEPEEPEKPEELEPKSEPEVLSRSEPDSVARQETNGESTEQPAMPETTAAAPETTSSPVEQTDSELKPTDASEPKREEPKSEKPKSDDKKKPHKRKLGKAKDKDGEKKSPKKKKSVTFQGICDKLKSWKEKKESFFEFIHKEENIKTFRLVKHEFFVLLKHILPTKIKGKVRFGFDDPYTTGQVLTYISPFYGLYARKLTIIPVFDEKVVEGELSLKGRVRVAKLLVIAIRLILDKNLRTLWKKWHES